MALRFAESSIGRLAGVFITTAAVASMSPGFEPEPRLQRPLVHTISFGADTAWFCGSMYPGAASSDFAWVRQSRTWKRVDATMTAPCSGERPRYDERDTIPIGDRLTLLRVRPKPGSDGNVVGRAWLTLVDSTSGRRIDLKPRIDTSHLNLIDPGYELGMDTLTTIVGAVAVSDTLVWIGLSGGFAEGGGEIGGMFRVDRRTGAYELIIDKRLADHTVTGIASVGTWLWVGVEKPAEYGPYGDAGLLQMDHQSRAWRSYTDSTSPLPDALIRTVKSDGRILAIATELGIAVAELRDRGTTPAGDDDAISGWAAMYFVPAFVGDSMVFDLAAEPLNEVAEARATILQRFGKPGRERPLNDALMNLPLFRLEKAAYADRPEDVGDALADTSLIPTLVAMLSTAGEGQTVGALALGKLGPRAPREAVAAMRAAFLALDSASADASFRVDWQRPRLGRALLGVGDSTPVRWARAALDNDIRSNTSATRGGSERDRAGDIISASAILASIRDRIGLTLLMGVAPTAPERAKDAIAVQLAAYDEPMAWGVLVSLGRGRQLPTRAVLDVLTPSALRDPTVAARVQDLIGESLRDSTGYTGFRAVYAVERLRLIGFAPTLVRALEPGRIRDGVYAEWSVRALVSMTGRGDAPVYADSIPPRAVFDWWQSWLAATNGKPVLVSEDMGRRALAEWSSRFYAVRR